MWEHRLLWMTNAREPCSALLWGTGLLNFIFISRNNRERKYLGRHNFVPVLLAKQNEPVPT